MTGGTGLVGSHLAKHIRDRDGDVVALCRATSDTSYLREIGCTLVKGDIGDDPDSLSEGMRGCTHLVHAAALVYAGGGWPVVSAVNVDGTRRVITAAARAGVEHVLHVSSVAVYGTVPGPVDERHPIDGPLPEGDLYARSKREAEDVARALARELDFGLTIVRPSAVYGERDRLMVPALARILRSPVVPIFGSGRNTLPVVYAANVASAIHAALAQTPAGAIYDIGLDHPLRQEELFQGLAETLGKRRRFAHIPAGAVRGVVGMLNALGVGTPGAPHLPLERVASLALGENPYPSRTIRSELGWSPPHDHTEGLARAGRWYLEHS